MLTSDRAVWCWGYNAKGQIGTGSVSERSQPAQVVGLTSGVIAITAGDEHSCAIVAKEADPGYEVRCWGSNSQGQLGANLNPNSAPHRTTPVLVDNYP